MTKLQDLRRAAARKSVEDRAAALENLPPRRRLDGGLGLALLGALGLSLAAGGVFASWASSSGVFDPPLLETVEDPRILTDYRDAPSPIVDLVRAGEDLLMGRRDGLVTRFDLDLRRFDEERLPRSASFSGDLAFLAKDCAAADCPGGGEVFALTEQGGLARREGGRWRAVLGDMRFLGVDGAPVEQAAVKGWAASDDGLWTLVDAGAKGLGLFHQREGTWSAVQPLGETLHGPFFQGGAFWIAEKRGIHRLEPSAKGLPQNSRPLPGAEGETVDLALAPDGLIAVMRKACAQGGGAGCLSLLKLSANGAEALLSEVEANPTLNDAGLLHAVRQGDSLLTLGAAGAHRYDLRQRRWTAMERRKPDVWSAGAGGDPLHVAFPDRFLTLSGGRIARDLPLEAPLVQILPQRGGEVFALDRLGRVIGIGRTTRVVAPADSGAPANARFALAGAIGTVFVAIGPEGALIHDAETRRYAFAPGERVPAAAASEMLAVSSAGRLWLVSKANGEVRSLRLSGEFPQKTLAATRHGALNRRVVRAQAAPRGLHLIDAEGGAFEIRLEETGFSSLLGRPLSGAFQPKSLAAAGSRHVFADERKVWLYDRRTRGWEELASAPAEDRLEDLALTSAGLAALGAEGVAYRFADRGWRPLSNGPAKAAFPASAAQDAMAEGGALYLASGSRVQAYSPGARRFGRIWRGRGAQAEILAVLDQAPLWKTEAGVFHGERPLFAGHELLDAWMGASGAVALARSEGRRHLVDAAAERCLHYGAPAPQGEAQDVVDLGGGRLLVRTAQEAGLYEPRLHRWLKVSGLNAGPESRFFALSGHLARLDPNGFAVAPLAGIPARSACARQEVAISWERELSGLQASLSESSGELLLLGADGAVSRWRAGSVERIARPTTEGPDPGAALKAYPAAGGLELLTASRLWRYDAARRIWSAQEFQNAPAPVSRIDLSREGAQPTISIWDAQGGLWAAIVPEQGPIRFAKRERPVLPAVPIPPAEIRDMAAYGEISAFLSDRRLTLHRRGEAEAYADYALPQPERAWTLASDESGALILIDGDPQSPLATHRIARPPAGSHALSALAAVYRPGPDRASAFAREGGAGEAALLRIDEDLRSWRCALPAGAAAPDCRLLADRPLEASAQDLRGAGRDEAQGVFVLLGEALLRLDAASRRIGAVEGPRVGAESQLFQNGAALLFWEGPGGALWRLRGDQATRLLASADHLRRLSGGRIAALSGGELVALTNGETRLDAPPAPFSGEAVTKRLPLQNGEVLLLASGRATAGGGLVSPESMRFSPDLQSLAPVPRRPERWLEADAKGALTLRFMARCAAFTPPEEGVMGPLPPTPTPCPEARSLEVSLVSGERLLDLFEVGSGGLSLLTNRRAILLNAETLRVISEAAAPQTALGDAAFLNALRQLAATVDGRSFLNPPRLSERRFEGIGAPSFFTALKPSALRPFDLGWLSWRREDKRLEMRGGASFSPSAFIRDGLFLPAHEARGAALSGERSAWINAHGLWLQEGASLSRLSAQGLTAETLDQGIFLKAAQGVAAQDGRSATPPRLRSFDLGGLRLTTDPFAMKVAARLEVSGQRRDAFAASGFQHDRRLSIALSTASGPVYLTPLGAVPLASLSGAFETPSGADRLANDGGRLLARAGESWRVLEASGGWVEAAAPFSERLLAQENGRVWRRVGGAVELSATESWRIARRGLDFDADQLLAFAATPRTAVAVTRAGTHAAAEFAALAGPRAAVAPTPGDGPLKARRATPTEHVLYAETAAGPLVWDAARTLWRAPQAEEKPWERRHAAEIEGISARFEPEPRFTIPLERIGEGLRPEPFGWGQGEAMPFDAVQALHGDGESGDLLLGTRFGLRRLTPHSGGWRSSGLFAPSAASGGGLAVTALGRPAAAPERIAAVFGAGGCLEAASASSALRPCRAAPSLDERLEAADGFWRWTRDASGLEGAYLLADGREAIPARLDGGFPHDRFADRAICGGVATELWRDAPVYAQNDVLRRLPGASALHCQEREGVLEGSARLAAGLHALAGEAVWRLEPAPRRLGAAQAAAVADRIAGRVVLEHGRLRYGVEEAAPRVERRRPAGVWVKAAWLRGRLALDQPRWIAWHGRGLQFVTEEGVADAPAGRIPPASLTLMTGDALDSVRRCDPQGVEIRDGATHAIPAAPGNPLSLRCGDGSRLEGPANGARDLGAFVRKAGAAQERSLLREAGLIEATQSLDAAGAIRSVAFRFRGEPVRLTAGRFDFDLWLGVAAPFAGRLELLTGGGWWRSDAADPALTRTERGPARLNGAAARGLLRDLSPTDEAPGLCLSFDSRRRFWDGADLVRDVEACREARGRDPLWRWWAAEGKASATGLALNGAVLERALVGGRFSDLVLTGGPARRPDGDLLAPTLQGVLVLNAEGAPRGSYGFEAKGLLARGSEGAILHVGRHGATLLEGEGRAVPASALACPALAALGSALPADAAPLRVEPELRNVVASLLLEGPQGRFQGLLRCRSSGTAQAQAWTALLDLHGHPRRLSLGISGAKVVMVSLRDDGLRLLSGWRQSRTPAPAPRALRGLAAAGDDVYLVDDRSLWRISGAAAIGALDETKP